MSKRPHLEAYTVARRARTGHRAPVAAVHDRRATDLPKGVIPASCEVSDPYDDGGGKITVIRNLRGDVLAQLWSRKQIEEHQYAAGRLWQGFYASAGIGTVKAMDTTKEPVDGGGGVTEVLTDRVLISVKKLARADADLGLEGKYLIIDVLGKGLSLETAAALRGAKSTRDREFWGKRLRECLDTLAVSYGCATKQLTRRVAPV